MHGFVCNPALARLVALQMVDEELQKSRRSRRSRTFRARLAGRLSSPSAARAGSQRVRPSGKLAEQR
jgi:hypothetical protein